MNVEDSLDCIFCKIVAGEIATEVIAENSTAIAFADISPQAPVHLLVVPRRHSANVTEVTDSTELDGVMSLVREVAAKFTNGQFRLQFNTGSESGQTVFHTHAHILSRSAA
jgi:histidine triad (HIT) family protein